MEFDLATLGWLCFFIGLSSFVDSIAGGGGVISTPAYLALGFPPHITLGTGKCASVMAHSVAIARYGLKGRIAWRLAGLAMAAAFAGSLVGARLALWMSERLLLMVMLVVLPAVAVFLIFRRPGAREAAGPFSPGRGDLAKGAAIGLVIGVYEGMLGPGTGTFLILAFSGLLGMDLLTASGTAKVVNFAGTVAAVVVYLSQGKVLWAYALPTALCGMLGSFLGSGLALKNGERVIRPMMLVVTVLLFAKVGFDLLAG